MKNYLTNYNIPTQQIPYEEAKQASQKYFNGSELEAEVFLNKYALQDSDGNLYEKTPDDMHRRIAREFARIEARYPNPRSEEEIYQSLKGFKYIIPQGSPMAAIGNPLQLMSLSNCFVWGNKSDSYPGIMKTDEGLTNLMKRRAGVGTDMSHLRPAGTGVKNAAKSSTGAVSFMERYSNTTREVAQSGRRGALMLTLSALHPDIMDFIDIKMDETKVTGANISLRMTDNLMEAIRRGDTKFTLQFPVDVPVEDAEFTKEVNPQEIWQKTIYNAWFRAEPGCLFWDTIIRESLPDCYADLGFNTISTNPCQPDFATVLTKKGITQFKDLKEGMEIWSETGWTKVVKKWQTGIKPVYSYQTTSGEFISTNNHRIVQKGKKIEIDSASTIDLLPGNIKNEKLIPEIVMDGLLIGDGSTHKTSKTKVYLDVGEDDSDYFTSEISPLFIEPHSVKKERAWKVKTSLTVSDLPHLPERKVPEKYLYGTNSEVKSFLRGLYSANGSICDTRVTLKTTSGNLVTQVQLMLNSIGIRSYYTRNKPSKIKWANGTYTSKESFDINITSDRDLFFKYIGFIQKYKTAKLKEVVNKIDKKRGAKSSKITEKKYLGNFKVYEITVDNSPHTYWSNGFNSSNCGEIPLPIGDSCRLMALNLLSFVEKPFTSNAKFNFSKFHDQVVLAQRLMDDLIDLEIEHVEAIIAKIKDDPEPLHIKRDELEMWKHIKQMAIKGRRTGLGITAMGDMLAAMGFRYGTPEANSFAEKVMRVKKHSEYESSMLMAQERGSFPIWDHEREKDNVFLNRIKDENPELFNLLSTHGRRNIALSTIAPTGTVSLMAQTSSGIENVFSIVYYRNRKINPGDKTARVDFVDKVGDSWQEYPVFHPTFLLYLEANGVSREQAVLLTKEEVNDWIKKSPYYKATANDTDWVKKVEMQGMIQKHIDHSISVTTNLPADIPVDTVKQVYMKAWESGCKGVTIYRDTSRSGVLNTESKKEKEKDGISHNNAPKRPKILQGDLYHVTAVGERWTVIVGLMGEDPYEVFAIKGEFGRHKSECAVKKIRKGHYDVETLEGETIESDFTTNNTEEEASLTRLISTALRHGAKIDFVVEQLNKSEGGIVSFSKAIARTLNKYADHDEEKIQQLIADNPFDCPNDGKDCQIEYSEGCLTCKTCGASKCT